MQGYKGTGVQGYKGTGVQGYNGAMVLREKEEKGRLERFKIVFLTLIVF